MAGNDYRDRISVVRQPHGAKTFRRAHGARDIAVGHGGAVGNLLQGLPAALEPLSFRFVYSIFSNAGRCSAAPQPASTAAISTTHIIKVISHRDLIVLICPFFGDCSIC